MLFELGSPFKKGTALLNDVVVLKYTQFTGVGTRLPVEIYCLVFTANC